MISVIIPSFNSGQTVEHTLKGLNAQTKEDLIAEIIVVDSSDDIETKKILSRFYSDKTKVINAGVRIMPAVSRNIGVAHANGKILAFIDADSYPTPDWIENIIKAYGNGCKVGGGSIELPDFQKNNPLALAQYYLESNEYIPAGNDRIKRFVPACNMFCEKELFKKVGGFPEIRAAEDVLFGLNISRTEKVWFIPAIKIYHTFRECLKRFLENQILLGEHAIKYRRLEMKNRFYYKNLWSLFFLPAFFMIKLLRITIRILLSKPLFTVKYLITLPIFVLGLIFWALGFARGILKASAKIGV